MSQLILSPSLIAISGLFIVGERDDDAGVIEARPSLETPIGELRFAGIDFESAGAARGRTDVPVQIGMGSWSLAGGVESLFDSYLRSDHSITWAARKVHGIRDEDLVGAPSLIELWPQVREQLGGAAVVAHGQGTEKRFLRAFPGHGFGPWIDTLLLARAAWPDLPDHSLGAVCRARGLDDRVREWVPGRQWHDALFDAVASLLILEDLVQSSQLAAQPLEVLRSPNTSPWHRKSKHRG